MTQVSDVAPGPLVSTPSLRAQASFSDHSFVSRPSVNWKRTGSSGYQVEVKNLQMLTDTMYCWF
jgi:hypothetical protein